MDPGTVYAVGTFLILAIGAFLGGVHRTLPKSVQPAAKSWRIANLVVAAGIVMLSAAKFLPPILAVPFANMLMLLGAAGFMHALDQFYERRTNFWLFLPAAIIPPVLYWFVVVSPNFQLRVLLASVSAVYIYSMGLYTLYRGYKFIPSVASLILFGAIAVTTLILFIRAVVFGMSLVQAQSLLDASHWANAASAMVIVIAPIIFTVAFLLMCVDRVIKQWREAASTDYLTGLPNRRTFTEQAAHLLQHAKGNVAIAILDIDHFKQINDRYGHDIGDVALKNFAEALKLTVRPQDFFARLGGEEFALAYEVNTPDDAVTMADRVRKQIEHTPFTAQNEQKAMTASIGIAISSGAQDRMTLDQLLKQADEALYQAKQGGRNRVAMA